VRLHIIIVPESVPLAVPRIRISPHEA
jgi:hypothetical protein